MGLGMEILIYAFFGVCCLSPVWIGPVVILLVLAWTVNYERWWWFLVAAGVCFIYFSVLGGFYYRLDDLARYGLFIGIPALAGTGGVIWATREWQWRGFRISGVIYAFTIYILVGSVAFYNMTGFMQCSHDVNDHEWSLTQLITWPYWVVRGDPLPDLCSWH